MFKNFSIVIFGGLINSSLGILFFVLAARILGPGNFGLFATSIAVLIGISDLISIPASSSLVKFGSKDNESLLKAQKESFFFLLKFAGILTILALFLSWPISFLALKNREIFLPLSLSFLGILPICFLSFISASYQAEKKFFELQLLNIFSNVLRLILFSFFALLTFNVNLLVINFILPPFFAFLLGIFFLKFNFLKVLTSQSFKNEFYSFLRGIFFSISSSAIFTRLDSPMVLRLSGAFEAGIYSAAQRLTPFFPQISGSISQVLAPEYAKAKGKEIRSITKKAFILIFLLAIPIIFAIIFSGIIIKILYGNQFLSSSPILKILLFAMIIFLLQSPLVSLLLYREGKSNVLAILSFAQLVLVFFSNIFLIQIFGGKGAALSGVFAYLFLLFAILPFLNKYLFKK